ncbi:hypothetical protein Tco_0713794, partial [Tanacetum coccineum]
MAIVRFHCPFAGLNRCHDGGGNGLTRAYLITHLRERHCTGEAQAITKHSLLTDLVVFERAELDHIDGLLHDQHDGFTLSLLDSLFSKGLCTVKSIPPKCRLSFSRVLKGALDKKYGALIPDEMINQNIKDSKAYKTYYDFATGKVEHNNNNNNNNKVISKGLRTVKSIPPKCRLGFSRVLKGALDKLANETLAEFVSPMLDIDKEDLDLSERNLK